MSAFISYPMRYEKVAGRIAQELQNRGIDYFYAKEHVGNMISDSIADGLGDSNVAIILMADETDKGRTVRKELHRIDDLDLPTVPVIVQPQYRPKSNRKSLAWYVAAGAEYFDLSSDALFLKNIDGVVGEVDKYAPATKNPKKKAKTSN